jgi:hypothetical protein
LRSFNNSSNAPNFSFRHIKITYKIRHYKTIKIRRAYAEKSTGLFVHAAPGISHNPTLKKPNTLPVSTPIPYAKPILWQKKKIDIFETTSKG